LGAICRVQDCDSKAAYKKDPLCYGHYKQKRAGIPFKPTRKPVSYYGEICLASECEDKNVHVGYCVRHYQQVRHNGRITRVEKRVPTLSRDPQGRKYCSGCRVRKPEGDFAKSASAIDGLQSSCRECRSGNYRLNAETVRDRMREYRFNLSRQQFDDLLDSQNGRCAICSSDTPGKSHWAVDHDHACCPESGRSCGDCIRGILCGRCNLALGLINDDASILESMKHYLQDATQTRSAR
jgi:hypothetical protein